MRSVGICREPHGPDSTSLCYNAGIGRVLFGFLSSIQAHGHMELGDVWSEAPATLSGNCS